MQNFFGHYYMHGSDTLINHCIARFYQRGCYRYHQSSLDHCGMHCKRRRKIGTRIKNASYRATNGTENGQNPSTGKASLKDNISPIPSKVDSLFIEKHQRIFRRHHAAPQFITQMLWMLPQLNYKAEPWFCRPTNSVAIHSLALCDGLRYVSTHYTQRSKFLEEAVQNDYALSFEHDSAECCTLQQTETCCIRRRNF
jgi:hypothetical protein